MKRITILFALLALVGCEPYDGQSEYKASEVGVSRAVEFGTILNVRQVKIDSKDSKAGELGGAAVGAGAGSYLGNGSGSLWTAAGGAVAGAVAGYYTEHAIYDRVGNEYVLQLQSGETKTIVQEQKDGDVVFKPGDKVMLQYCDAGNHARKCADDGPYQRLLPIAKLPPYVKKKRKFVQTKETGDSTADKPQKQADDDDLSRFLK